METAWKIYAKCGLYFVGLFITLTSNELINLFDTYGENSVRPTVKLQHSVDRLHYKFNVFLISSIKCAILLSATNSLFMIVFQ